jgi:hypothetical protein
MIQYQGKSIFFADFSNLQTISEIESVITENKAFMKKQSANSMFTLTTIEGMHFNNEIKELFIELGKHNKPYVKAGALVGVTGLKQIMYNGIMKLIGRDMKLFSTIEQAQQWLVSLK